MTHRPTAEQRPGSARSGRLPWLVPVAPYALLGLSLAIVLATGGPGANHRWPTILTLSAIALAYRAWWNLAKAPRGARIVGFVVHLVLTLALISLSPLFGVYAFVGYLDAVALFSGHGLTPALVAVASLNALAQSGGPAGVAGQPVIFAFLLTVNGVLAVAMVNIDKRRQENVTRLQRALRELEEARRVNNILQEQLIRQARESGTQAERQRLSREIHDTVAQGLIALLRQIEAAAEALSLPEARRLLGKADQTARDSLAEARRAVSALASPILDDADLSRALHTLVATWSDVTGVTAHLEVHGPPAPTHFDAELVRVCQEALANIAKHAAATDVVVCLEYSATELRLFVRDDGLGFDPDHTRSGHGLPGVRDRLRLVGGQLIIETREGEGCTLSAAVPR